MRFLKTYWLTWMLCLTTSLLFAQKNDSLQIKKTEWEKVVKGIDYTENYKELDQPKEKNLNFSQLKYDWSALKYVFYCIVIGLVLFLIIKILMNLKKNPNIKKQDFSIESMKEIEEKMHEIDLDLLLSEALAGKNFHIALRINFLIIIKLLSEKKLIIWAKEKTNWEYHSEIKEVMLKDGFKAIVFVFEPVWYGERHLTEAAFYLLQPTFDNLKKQLLPNE
ncbi:MAG: hypothetical protein A3K10_13525 [Bacteroidetes bacterium RIFCSPLOWO2_12_FULL_31_6]|nr:MAG: hypothetical protein A3K10_13525 [Bacteroidetes bacterium RIFCSPLOWO2_12_FULL_31_6]